MTSKEAEEEIKVVCEELARKTEVCLQKITAFLDYYFQGVGREPCREDYPSTILNPKANGTNLLLKRLRDALGEFMPHELPSESVASLAEFVRSGTGLICDLEAFHRYPSLDVSRTTELDIFSYMTMRREGLTSEHHRQNLKAKFKAMKASFYANSQTAYEIETEIILHSPHHHPPRSKMTQFGERFRELRRDAVIVSANGRRPKPAQAHVVTIPQAVELLKARCEKENLADFARTERTLKRWESSGGGPAGYSANCRVSVQAFAAWLDGYIVASRLQAVGRASCVSFCDNLHSTQTDAPYPRAANTVDG